jgi:mannose-6-phosphate isomerase-like protein (cupin superfamily)
VRSWFRTLAEIGAERTRSGKLYREFLRAPAMSAGLYVLPAGTTDPQKPHHEDELYYVLRGRARMRVGSKQRTAGGQAQEEQSDDQAVSEGSVIFVAAGVEHRFYDITEELVVLVVFAPAES